jgi:hypothetical protein
VEKFRTNCPLGPSLAAGPRHQTKILTDVHAGRADAPGQILFDDARTSYYERSARPALPAHANTSVGPIAATELGKLMACCVQTPIHGARLACT